MYQKLITNEIVNLTDAVNPFAVTFKEIPGNSGLE